MRHNIFAIAGIMALAGAGGGLCRVDEPGAVDVPMKRKRNYDIEGPAPVLGPPQNPTPTRQLRRKAERQAKKSR